MKLKGFFKRVFSYKKKIKNQKGFTLLELLIVVAILATIAGTASMAYNDIDKRASAAAHVAMMDELNKGVRTYRAIQRDTLPTKFDSLMVSSTTADVTAGEGDTGVLATLGFSVTAADSAGSFASDAAYTTLPDDVQQLLIDAGLTQLQYITEEGAPADYVANTEDCTNANIQALVESKANMVVAGNLFLTPSGNGCGKTFAFAPDTVADASNDPNAVFWIGDTERLTGQVSAATIGFDGGNLATANSEAMLLVGMGPSSTLFDGTRAGGMTTVPVYRHVAAHEYNRFIAVLDVGDFNGSGVITAGEKVHVVAIVDGALDTKEEELGEWDGQRAT